jgi:hypothetical protein
MKVKKNFKKGFLYALLGLGCLILFIGFIYTYLYLCFKFFKVDPLDPIFSYQGYQQYKADRFGQWTNYEDKEMNLSFEYPTSWTVNLGRYSNCADGKAVWINNTHARAHIIICKDPYLTEPPYTPQPEKGTSKYHYLDGVDVKTIKTPYTTFYSRNLNNNRDLSITDYAVSEDRTVEINVQIPYTSETGRGEIEERDKIFLRILNSIKAD